MHFPLGAFALPAFAGLIHTTATIHTTAIALRLATHHQAGIVDEPAGWVLLSAGVALVLVSRSLVRR